MWCPERVLGLFRGWQGEQQFYVEYSVRWASVVGVLWPFSPQLCAPGIGAKDVGRDHLLPFTEYLGHHVQWSRAYTGLRIV